MSTTTAIRYHDICMGHRVVGHEGKCRNLHGHNYRFTFYCAAPALDSVGRVIDFSVIKSTLCEWLEVHWDHRMMMWDQDPLQNGIINLDTTLVLVPFNPTAENIAQYFVEIVAPVVLANTGVTLQKLELSETRKCSVTYEIDKNG